MSGPEPPDGAHGGGSLAARLRSLVAALDAAAHRDRHPSEPDPNGEAPVAEPELVEAPPLDSGDAADEPAAPEPARTDADDDPANRDAAEPPGTGAKGDPANPDVVGTGTEAEVDLANADVVGTGTEAEVDLGDPEPDRHVGTLPTEAEAEPVDPTPATAVEEEPVAPTPATEAEAEPADPTPATEAEAEPADPTPPTDADADPADPTPGTEADAEPVAATPAAEVEAEPVDPAPGADTQPEPAGPAPVAAMAEVDPAGPAPVAAMAESDHGGPASVVAVAEGDPAPDRTLADPAPAPGGPVLEPAGVAAAPRHPPVPSSAPATGVAAPAPVAAAPDAVQPALFDAAPGVATLAPPEPQPEPLPPAPAPPQPALFEPVGTSAPRTGERARRRKRQKRRRRLRTFAFLLTLVVLVAAIPVLAYLGVRTISDSNEGRVIEPETDASAPGFEAVVDPTPTLLLAHEDGDGDLAGLTILALGLDDEGGDVLFIPTGTMVEIPSFGLDRLAVAFDRGGLELVRQSSENLLGISFTDAVRVDPDRWAELVGPVAPLQVANPDPIEVVDADGRVDVAFSAGTIDVTADQVSDLLSLESVDETQLARLVRHQAFWEAWLAAIAASPSAEAVPGEVSTGLGRFVRGLADGDVVYETLHVETISASLPGGEEVYQADRDAVAAQISEILPFAAAPEGGNRARVRILNGTGEPGLAQSVTSVLVPAGAEITVVGNADDFDYETTQVVFYDQADEAVAERLRDALGVGEVVFSRVPNDAVDVTVVVGSDFEPPAAADGADEAGSDSTG